ncbi:MAG: hypothetical protein ACLGJB_11475 [Blastocatellia bacterium]
MSALLSLGVLIFSGEFSAIWKPLFGKDMLSPTIGSSLALHIMFFSNIFCIFGLVQATGGSYSSSFSPLYFILPALAIFLRESFFWIAIYVVIVACLVTLQLREVTYHPSGLREIEPARKAYWFISISCLVLTTVIAYVTRPI